MAFSLARAARPAEADGKPDVKPLPNKRPRCSDLIVQGPLPPQPKRQTTTADVEVCIYKFTDDAASVWDDVKEPNVPLYQIQLRHDAVNSICVNLYDKFNSFLKTQDGVPQTLVELQKQALIKLVTTDGQDPDNIGFQRWRNAFYVAGETAALLNFIYLLDEFWLHASEAIQGDLMVVLYPHCGVDIDACWDVVLHKKYTLYECDARLPMGIFAAQPVQGKRVLLMTVQVESDEKLTFAVYGATWPFRDRFEAAGIPGYRQEPEDGPPKYYRVLENVDSGVPAERERVAKMLGDVLRNTAMRVHVDGVPKPGTSAFRFIQTLRKRTHLHFA